MAGKTVSFYTYCDLNDTHLQCLAKWLSCNGEIWGMGPTVVFASAAALFLYNEIESTIFNIGDHARITLMEKTLISTMVLGMLSLMVHLWVCSMRFFQVYLDALIRDSPSMLLELTTVGFLGGQGEMMPLAPMTKFLRQQQPQIHITVCWFLSLCYADYVRKHYCARFNVPYLEQWQTELHERAARGVHRAMERVNSFVSSVHQRLRGYTPHPLSTEQHTACASPVEVGGERGTRGSRSEGALAAGPDLCLRLHTRSNETTRAIDTLRSHITATRCTCRTPQNTTVSATGATARKEAAS